MKWTWLWMALVAAAAAAMAPRAVAAEVTEADYRYLQSEYGVGRQDETVSSMSAEQQKQLHALINDPQLQDVPAVRHDRVAAYLFDVHMRHCQDTAASHPDRVCPPARDAKLEPGKDIADRQCNFCHLFGVGGAPSFHKLARQGPWAADALSEAQRRGHENARRHGHQMSPIGLTREELDALAVYIQSLK
jgi:cytochrome c5